MAKRRKLGKRISDVVRWAAEVNSNDQEASDLINQSKSAKKHHTTKRRGKVEKRRSDIARWAAKAKSNAQKASDLINQFELAGYEIDKKLLITMTLDRIEEIESKPFPRDYDLQLLKDYARVTQFDYIKISMPIRGQENDGISVPEEQEVSLRDVRLAQRRQVVNPQVLTDKEHQILSQYAAIFGKFASSKAPVLDTPEQQQTFKDQFNVIRDVSIGGSSMLINDLSYTYDALSTGRYFVEQLQKIMSNPDDFVQIEAWYRGNAYIKQTIDQAVKAMWYEKFKEFSTAIIEAINTMPNVSQESENILDQMEIKLEEMADEEFY